MCNLKIRQILNLRIYFINNYVIKREKKKLKIMWIKQGFNNG